MMVTKEKIKEQKLTIREAELKLQELLDNCKHEGLEEDETVRCTICGKWFGWYCPDNPNRKLPVCEYDNGNEDECDWCGAPDERK